MVILTFPKIVLCSEKFSYLEKSGIKDALARETGKERVLKMFKKTEMGFTSPELIFITQNSLTITILSAAFGAVVHMNKAKEDFMRQNVASTFESQHLGRRALLDTMSFNGIKGAISYALRFGSFGSLYLLSTMTIENYRNKLSIWEHMGTAAVLGGISRVKYGVKGVLVASCLGGFLGSIAGGILLFNMWMSGTTFEDFRYWHYERFYTQKLKRKMEELDK